MKWMISIVVLLCLIPIPVVQIEGETDQYLKVITHEMTLTLLQEHSVNFTPIKEVILITRHGLLHQKTLFEDQGGAGMPNHKLVQKDASFYIDQHAYLEEPVYLLLTDENQLIVEDKIIELKGTYTLERKQITLFQFVLYRIGAL